MEDLIKEIQQRKEKILHPTADMHRWDQALSEFGFPVFNWTDGFNYDKCHTYEILLHHGKWNKPTSMAEAQALITEIGGDKYSILLKISVIMPYFLVDYVHQFLDNQKINEEIGNFQNEQQCETTSKLKKIFRGLNFKEIPRSYLKIIVPGIKLEFSDPATVYNCLFIDE